MNGGHSIKHHRRLALLIAVVVMGSAVGGTLVYLNYTSGIGSSPNGTPQFATGAVVYSSDGGSTDQDLLTCTSTIVAAANSVVVVGYTEYTDDAMTFAAAGPHLPITMSSATSIKASTASTTYPRAALNGFRVVTAATYSFWVNYTADVYADCIAVDLTDVLENATWYQGAAAMTNAATTAESCTITATSAVANEMDLFIWGDKNTIGGITYSALTGTEVTTQATTTDVDDGEMQYFSNTGTAAEDLKATASTSEDSGGVCLGVYPSAVPPGPTSLVSSSQTTTTISLSWTDYAADSGWLTAGTVEDSLYTSSCAALSASGATVSTPYDTATVSSLTEGDAYCFAVSVSNSTGASGYSATLSDVTTESTPTTPTAVSATTDSDSEITVAWTNPTGANPALTDDYVNWYSPSATCTGTETSINVGSVTTSYGDTGLSNGVVYSYTVQAANTIGEGTASSCVTATTDNAPPSAPTALSATAASDSQINLAWTNPSGTLTNDEYEEWSGSGCSSSGSVTVVGSVVTSMAVTSLSADTAYSFEVAASTNGGYGSYSACEGATTDNTPPSAPTGLSATAASDAQINLAWTNPSGTLTDDEYEQWAGAGCSGGGTVTDIGSVVTSESVTGLSTDTTYSYEVAASTNGGYGSFSTCQSVTTDNAPPSAPTGFSATAASTTQINLAWTNPSGTLTNTEYEQWSGSGCSSGGTVTQLGAVDTSYSVTGLTENTAYSFEVAASTNGGYGSYSSCEGATTLNTPSAPTGLSATTASDAQINLAWTNPSGTLTDDEYEQWAGAGCSGGGTVTDIGSVVTSESVTGLSTDTTYSYEVAAANAAGYGPYSSCEGTTTDNAPPGAPTALTATTTSDAQINLAWTNPSGTLTDDEYEQWSGAGCSGSGSITDIGSVVTSKAVTSLSADTAYSFEVAASTNGGYGSYSSCASATTDNAPPGQPTSLSATAASDAQINIAWTNPSGTLTDDYVNEYAGSGCSGSPTTVNIGSVVTSYMVTGLSTDTAYSYTVAAATNGGEGTASSCEGATTDNAPPGQPTGLSTTTASDSQVNLAWTNPAGTLTNTEYEQWAGSGCSSGGTVTQLGAVDTSYSVTGLSTDTAYSFEVAASTNGGYGSFSSCEGATTDNAPPGAPTAFTATTASDAQVNLAWTNPSGTLTDDEYEQWSGSGCSSGGTLTDLGAVDTSYSVTALSADTAYSYEVAASTNGGYGSFSSCEAATTDNAPPVAPTSLSAAAASDASITLTWTNPGGTLTDNEVEKWSGASCAGGGTVIDLGAVDTSYTVTSLLTDTTYSFEVAASTNGGFGAYSSCAYATTDNAPPAAPTGLSAAQVSDSEIDLAWTNPGGTLTDDYVNEYVGSGCSGSPDAVSLGEVVTAYEDTGLSADSTYSYTVAAATNGGEGSASTCASATTDNEPPSAPTGLSATTVSDAQINLAWTNPEGSLTDTEYEQWSGASCSGGGTIVDLGAVDDGYSVTGLTADTAYSFEVAASTNGGYGSLSSCDGATTDNTPPSAPTAFSGVAVSDAQINLAWTNPGGTLTDDEYEQWAGAGCSGSGSITDIGSVVTSTSIISLSADTAYSYEVAASTNGGYGSFSSCVGATTDNAPPSAPMGLSATAASDAQINLAWTNPSGTLTDDEYEQWSGAGCSSSGSITDIGSVVTSKSITGLSADTAYSYEVAASTNGGFGSFSACEAATTDNTPPGSPTSLSAIPISSTQIDLAWTNPSGTLTDDYVQIWDAGSCSVSGSIVDIGSVATAYDNTGLTEDTTYSYEVAAATNGGMGDYSNCATTTSYTAPPSAPTGLSVTTASDNELALSWTNPGGSLTDNHVYEYAGGSCSGSPTDVDLSGVYASYEVTGLSASTTYSYTVTASTLGGEGPPSSCASGTTDNAPPSAPPMLMATAASDEQIDIAWTNPTGSITDDYVNEYSGGTCSGGATTFDLDAVHTAYAVTGLTADNTYSFTVVAATNGGEGSASQCAYATTDNLPPGMPTNLTAVPVSGSVIVLFWVNPGGHIADDMVYVWANGDCSGQSATVLDLDEVTTHYSYAGLTPLSVYGYEIGAETNGGEGPLTGCVNATTLSGASGGGGGGGGGGAVVSSPIDTTLILLGMVAVAIFVLLFLWNSRRGGTVMTEGEG